MHIHGLSSLRSLTRQSSLWLAASFCAVISCGPAVQREPAWPPLAKQWYERAQASFEDLDLVDAEESISKALKLQPQRAEIRELGARVALARLDYAGVVKITEGLASPRALQLRARAHWYAGEIEPAGIVLEQLLADPTVRDDWGKSVLTLARSGRGRKPYTIKGDRIAVMEMPHVRATSLVVPIELDGQPVFALINTGQSEVLVDSSGQSTWVNLRFGGRIEVKDVPAIAQDLSGLERELGAPVKVVLGSHALRHLNATVDFLGHQFVVRREPASPPPAATKVQLRHLRGGAMALSAKVGVTDDSPAFALLMDSSAELPLALDDEGWKRTGTDTATLAPVPGKANLTHAILPGLQIGAFSVPNIPVIRGVSIEELERSLDLDLDGILGGALLASFRVTFTDGGSAMWLEDIPGEMAGNRRSIGSLQRGSSPGASGSSTEAAAQGASPPGAVAPRQSPAVPAKPGQP